MRDFDEPQIKAVFDALPGPLKTKLMSLRELIFETAAEMEDVGPLEEALKWGQASYLTSKSKSGTTIRIARIKKYPDRYGLFVHCQTSLITIFRDLYDDELDFDGNRCIWFNVADELPKTAVRHCISLALSYHRHKKS
ncbi:MAG: DUF1801 domain-containing protein [Alphaproteobacteria bacterium]|jgi:hypothetical protein|nr:DUF1801 domain-containing protein [Alphaproteobacteria bacterium]MBT4020130.1 DUF1801 domain-containing protein [Alphaproteobacteria bacterium]